MIRLINFIFVLCLYFASSELSQNQQNGMGESQGFHTIERSFNATNTKTSDVTRNVTDNQLSSLVCAAIEHFKDPDPIGIPVLVPDPFPMPAISEKSIGVGKIHMTDARVFGSSRFRIQNINLRLGKKLNGFGRIKFDNLTIVGNYTIRTFLSSKGSCTISLNDVILTAAVNFSTNARGKLRTDDIQLKIDIFGEKSFNFDNIGSLDYVIQTAVQSKTIFEFVKNKIIEEAKPMIIQLIHDKIDEQIAPFGQLPNSIGLIDFAIAKSRDFIKNGFDPLKINDYVASGMFGYRIFDTELSGLSSIYRAGDLDIKIRSGVVEANFEIGTNELHGKTFWEVSLVKGMITRMGKLCFTVQFVRLQFKVTQPIDLSKNLKIDDLQINLGNIQLMSSGLGIVDYFVEFFVNTIPNILRYQIVDALERPIVYKILQNTDKMSPEQIVKKNLKEYIEGGTLKLEIFKREEL